MMPGIDPKQMKRMMQQMGIKNTEISATRVVIETEEGNIIVSNPQVTEIEMQGQKSFQIAGDVSKEDKSSSSEDDIKLIMEQTGASHDEALSALKAADGDIAEAIIALKSG